MQSFEYDCLHGATQMDYNTSVNRREPFARLDMGIVTGHTNGAYKERETN
jgi:hypothetical protein